MIISLILILDVDGKEGDRRVINALPKEKTITKGPLLCDPAGTLSARR